MVGGVHFPVSSEGCLNMALSNTMAYSSAAGQGESNIVTSIGSLEDGDV